jgi:hypothetical protein
MLKSSRLNANWGPTYLAVNSSKLSSWCEPSSPSLSERRLLLVLKLLTEPEVAIRAGTAYSALELRGVRLRRPLARKKVDGCARAAIRSIEVDDIRKDDFLRQLGGKFDELSVVLEMI